jgi:hypothetical protein
LVQNTNIIYFEFFTWDKYERWRDRITALHWERQARMELLQSSEKRKSRWEALRERRAKLRKVRRRMGIFAFYMCPFLRPFYRLSWYGSVLCLVWFFKLLKKKKDMFIYMRTHMPHQSPQSIVLSLSPFLFLYFFFFILINNKPLIIIIIIIIIIILLSLYYYLNYIYIRCC